MSSEFDWQDRAACNGEDPELFFPVGHDKAAQQQTELAKAVCRRCPVIDDCLRYALETGQDAGVWGGMSEDERQVIKLNRRTTRQRRTSQLGSAGLRGSA